MMAKTCARCGVQVGAASKLKRGLCLECQSAAMTRRGARTAAFHILLLISGAYVLLTGVTGPFTFLLLGFAFIDLLAIGMTAVHELAHAVTALLVGFEVREVSLGMGPRIVRRRFGRFRLVLRLYPVSGHTLILATGRGIRAKMIALTAAGPLSHIPVAAWLATLDGGDVIWDSILGWAPGFVLFYLALNVIPVFDNDGRNLFKLMTMPDARLGAISTLSAALSQLAPTLDDPAANPANRMQRDAIVAHLQNPGLEPADRAITLNNLAAIDLLMDDPELLDEIDAASAEAMELLPELAAIRNTRGAALIHLGRYAEGIELMAPTLGSVAEEFVGESQCELAYAYAREGDVFHARQHLAACRGRTARLDLYRQALTISGGLEVPVIRRFASESPTPMEAATRYRKEAGALAQTTGLALRAHIEATGSDTDLMPIALALAPEQV